jgi:ribosomal protein S18 acetylase RimI-like enzyme
MRPALPEDRVAGLLYESASPYYDVYAGGEEQARLILLRLFPVAGHTASFDVCTVAETPAGEVVGALVAFPATEAERLARRFMSLSIRQVPVYRWPRLARHLSASAGVAPRPPDGAFYIDALAVAAPARRRGVGRALLDEAARQGREREAPVLALDTGIENEAARALYRSAGFAQTHERRAPGRLTALLGGPGFVSYERELGRPVP